MTLDCIAVCEIEPNQIEPSHRAPNHSKPAVCQRNKMQCACLVAEPL